MPYYRFKFGIVHVRGSRMAAPCGARMLVDGREAFCWAPSAYLCDGPARHRSGTCDRALCEAHANQVAANAHLCPSCRTEALDELGQRNLFTHLVSS